MKMVLMKLVTIIADSTLEAKLEAEIKSLGAKGYSVMNARGEGKHGSRFGEWEGENVRIETLVSPEVAEKILERLSEQYFDDYAVVAFLETVEVVRGGKFS